jgi:uncharacterized protein YkwD
VGHELTRGRRIGAQVAVEAKRGEPEPHRGRNSKVASLPRLIAIGSDGPREFSLQAKRIAIGSGRDNDLVLAHPTVSRHHAVIRRRLGRVRVIDLESTNGTFINRKRIAGPTTLRRGDEVRFGAVRFAYLEPGGKRRRRPMRLLLTAGILAALFAGGFVATWHWSDALLARLEAPRSKPEERTAPAFEAPSRIARAPAARSSVAASAATIAARAVAPEAPSHAPVPANAPVAAASAAVKAPAAAPTEAVESTREVSWLARLNYYRTLASLPPVTEDLAQEVGDFKHARYLVKNHSMPNGNAHDEDPSNPWYSPEGLAAAKASDIYTPCDGCPLLSPAEAIDGWVSVPFHRVIMLNPNLTRAGFGQFTEAGLRAAVIGLRAYPPEAPLAQPIEFPPDGVQISMTKFQGEWPSPVASCAGYTEPAGLPITLVFGGNARPNVVATSLSRNGTPVQHCTFDATNYFNPDPGAQEWGRNILRNFGAVVIVPRSPLRKGASYQVSVIVNGKRYEWSFSVAP